MPTPPSGSTITFTNIATEFTLSINPPSRSMNTDFRFASGTYTPASPAIPIGAGTTIRLSADLGGRTKVGGGTDLYTFDNFLFTSSNVTGRTGTTLANFQTPLTSPGGFGQPFYTYDVYSNVAAQPWFASYWSLHNSLPGYQKWVVPATATYSVIACGAAGGWHQGGAIGTNSTASAQGGGYGAVVAGAFSFTKSQNLIITIGQQGVSRYGNVVPTLTIYQGKGGGGATTIVDAANTSVPILVAAGGGGQTAFNYSGLSSDFSGGRGNRAYAIITATGSTSVSGIDAIAGSNAAAASFGANGGGTTAAQSWANGSAGGNNPGDASVILSAGGFGGGGAGGYASGSQSKGGGGGGWIGGNGSQGVYGGAGSGNRCGGGGGVSYCLSATSPNVGASCIFQLGINQTTTSLFGISMPQVMNGSCWIKKMVARSTLLPLITFSDCYAYRYQASGAPTLADRSTYYTDANLTATLCPYWFGHAAGYHAWCVPRSGVYQISAAGGGGDYAYNGANFGGRGRIITARYNLNLGDVLIIQVGHRGYSSTTPVGFGGGGGCTTVHLGGMTAAWNGTSGNPMSTTYPGFPLIAAAAGNGGAAVAAGADADATDLTGLQSEGGGLIAATNNAISSGGNLYAETSGRTGAWFRTSVPNAASITDPFPGGPFAGAGGSGWGGGGRGQATLNLTGGGAGWVGGGGSNNGTGGGAQSYYWSSAPVFVSLTSTGYNSYPPSAPAVGTNVGSGYVTIQGIS